MGTRGLVGVVINNTPKATYNHFDSYPSGLGLDVVKFVDSIKGENFDTLAGQFQALTMIDADGTPTPEQIADLGAKGVEPAAVSTGADWYAWLRNAQGDLAEYVRLGYMPDGTTFGEDSLFCEWGYLVNLDTRSVEVYKGFQKEPHVEGFWATAPRSDSGYYGIKRIAVIPFDQLNELAMTSLESYDEEDED